MPASATHNGWRWDIPNTRLDFYYRGTRVGHITGTTFVLAAGVGMTITDTGLTITAGGLTVTAGSLHVTASNLGVSDDISIELGTDDDSVLRHRTATLAANTALTDVLVGTVVAQAIAANSLMVSNVTADGDIAIYGQTGGNSEQYLFMDTSAKVTYLGQTGHAIDVVNGAVKLTLGTQSTFATTQPTNALVFRGGTAPVGAITTAAAAFSAGTVLSKIIADGTASNIET